AHGSRASPREPPRRCVRQLRHPPRGPSSCSPLIAGGQPQIGRPPEPWKRRRPATGACLMRNHLPTFDRVAARLGPCEPLDYSLARLQQWACLVPLLSRRPTRYGWGRDALRAAENAGRAAAYALRAGRKGDDVTDPELWCELHALLMSGLLPPTRCGSFRDGNMLLLEPDGKPLACALPPARLEDAIKQTAEDLR